MTCLNRAVLLVSIFLLVGFGREASIVGANAETQPHGTGCYCDPIAFVDDCSPGPCQGFLISMFIMFLLLTIPATYYAIFGITWREIRRGSRARPTLLLLIWLMAFSRTLRFALLLGKVGEGNFGGTFVINLILIFGGGFLMSCLTLIVYIWIKVHKSAQSKIPRYHKERRILWIANIAMYTLLILFHALEAALVMDIFSLMFNAIVGLVIIVQAIGFLTYGVKLYRAASENALVSRSNLNALTKVTRLVGLISIISILYVILLTIFSLSDSRKSTDALIQRHSFYRAVEFVVGIALLVTFHQTKGSKADAKSQAMEVMKSSYVESSGGVSAVVDSGEPRV